MRKPCHGGAFEWGRSEILDSRKVWKCLSFQEKSRQKKKNNKLGNSNATEKIACCGYNKLFTIRTICQ